MNPFFKLKRLEFAVTYNCTSRCTHCFVEGAKKNKYPGHLNQEAAVKIVKDVGALYKLESVMTFGGESLLYPEVTCAIHRTATDLGIPTRQVITNGLWSKNPERVKEVAGMVVDAGVNNILISIDAFHAPYVSIDTLKLVAEIFLDLGIAIKWSPAWVKSVHDENRYNVVTRDLLKEVEYLGLPIGNGNVISPNGAAITNLAEYMPPKLKYPSGKCADQPYTHNLDNLQSICIEPNGDISICPSFVIGNAIKDDIKDKLLSYDPYQSVAMKCILEHGMDGLLNLAKKEGVQLDPEGYFTICEMCKSVVARIVQNNF